MSGADRDRRGGQDEPLMLVLGEDLPDVEDTTPEQLRLQEEAARVEIARQRQEAQQEIESRRREAEREIAELEARRARELEQREEELERTQHELYQRERRLRRRLPADGATSERLVAAPRAVPLSERGLRGSRRAWAAAALAVLGLLVATLTAPSPPSDGRLAGLQGIDEARVLWISSAAAATEALTLRVAGEEPPPGGVTEHLALAEQAVAATPVQDERRHRNALYTLEKTQEQSGEIFGEGTSELRALTLWDQMHVDLGYGVSQGQVREVREELLPTRGWAATGSVLAALALLGLAVLAAHARSRPSVILSGGAAALAVATFLAVLGGSAGGTLEEAAESHHRANLFLANVHSAVHDDLAEAYGTSTSPSIGGNHFAREPSWLTRREVDVDAYLAARAELGRAAQGEPEAVAAAAVELAAAGKDLLEAQFVVVEQARADLLGELRDVGPGRGLTAALAGGATLLAAAAVLASRGRRETA